MAVAATAAYAVARPITWKLGKWLDRSAPLRSLNVGGRIVSYTMTVEGTLGVAVGCLLSKDLVTWDQVLAPILISPVATSIALISSEVLRCQEEDRIRNQGRQNASLGDDETINFVSIPTEYSSLGTYPKKVAAVAL